MSDRTRWVVSIAVPLAVLLLALNALPRDIAEPAFVSDWPVEARAGALFALVLAALVGFQLAADRWGRWIAPNTFGRREPRSLLDNLSTDMSIAAVFVIAAYHKPLASAGWEFRQLFLVYVAVTAPLLGWQLWQSRRRYRALDAEAKKEERS